MIEPTGDYSIDTTEAHSTGDTVLRLKSGATLKVEIGGSTAFRVEDVGGWLRIELGDGADHRLVLGEKLIELLNRFFQNAFDMHVHPTPMGPSGPPLPPFVGGRLDESILSEVSFTKCRIRAARRFPPFVGGRLDESILSEVSFTKCRIRAARRFRPSSAAASTRELSRRSRSRRWSARERDHSLRSDAPRACS